MKSLTLSLAEAREKYRELKNHGFSVISLPVEHAKIRDDILLMAKECESENSYYFDVSFGAQLYTYLNRQPFFSPLVASDGDFWRYLAVSIIPDVVYNRFEDSDAHFFSKLVRIYPYTLYWFYHLCWQGDIASTQSLMKTQGFNSDTLLQLVERPGRNGIHIEVFRAIVRRLSAISATQKNNILRKVLVLHTARSIVVIPESCDGGIAGYVKMLFESVINYV